MSAPSWRLGLAVVSAGLVTAFSAAGAADRAAPTEATVANAIEELKKAAAGEIASNAVAGIGIAVVWNDKVIYTGGFGVRSTETGEPVDADTVFQLASVSKPIGSTVVARLVGEGKVTWDTRIVDIDPAFALNDPWVTANVTIRDLYSHRSGLPDHAGDLLEDLGFTREEILHRLRYQREGGAFRSSYAYTNFGMTEAGVAAAKAAGMEWEDASEELLYKPLGMTSTSSRFADFMARPNRAAGHVLVDGKWVPKFKRDADTESPAGGVSSSANDLAQWLRLQLGDGKYDGQQLVASAALDETHMPTTLTGQTTLAGTPQWYGLGWNVNYAADGRLKISHSGAFAYGTGTNVNLSPSDNLGVAVITNSAPTGVAEGFAADFMDIAIYGSIQNNWLDLYKGAFAQMMAAEGGDPAFKSPPASPRAAAPDDAYIGTYTNDFYGDIAIVAEDGGLAITQGPQPMKFAMTHFDGDIFTYETEGESAVGVSGITFTLAPDGHASAVLIDNLNDNGEGLFTRAAED